MKTEIVVIEVIYIRGVALVACDLLAGELRTGMKFEAQGIGGEWVFVGQTTIDPEMYSLGRRGITLKAASDCAHFGIGERLSADC
jgi:hypothetical protein